MLPVNQGLTLKGTLGSVSTTVSIVQSNSYLGPTSVSGGMVLVNGSLASTASVAGSATLGGYGSIVIANFAGNSALARVTLSPGDEGVDALASTGTVTLGAHSSFVCEISGYGGRRSHRRLVVPPDRQTLDLVCTHDPYAAWIAGYPGIADPAPDADPDGDGWSNEDERVTGTDPTNSGSRFTASLVPDGVAFERLAGRGYEVRTSISLAGAWDLHAVAPAGSGMVTIPLMEIGGPRRFYRVVVTLIP